MIDIDLTKFGLQTVTSNGDKALVTPSTPDVRVHDFYRGPGTFSAYNESTGEYDIQYTGYYTSDSDGNYRNYDISGALLSMGVRPPLNK